MADAWRAYDALFSDPKVAFIDEPAGTEARWRFLTQLTTFTPKVWNDAYLAAFEELTGLEMVTFDTFSVRHGWAGAGRTFFPTS
jgi:hypothetical protein